MHSNDDLLSSLHDIQSLEWILPETRQLLERQYKNQINQPKLKSSNIILITNFSRSKIKIFEI